MKKTMLCALMLAGLAAQSASAAIRTFEFTATVNFVRDFNNWDADTVYLPYDGITVSMGDLITGKFAFDDQGLDFGASAPVVVDAPAGYLSYTFLDANYTVDVNDPQWNFDNQRFGQGAVFEMWNNEGFKPTADLIIRSPLNAFSWELGNGTTASFGASFAQNGPPHQVGFAITGLNEVSPVPEPATWGMLLMGLGAVGAAAYRRRQGA